jgi:hypothetical protein
VAFQSSLNTVGFTGTFNVHDYGIFKLPAITSANASFGLNLSGTGLYYNNTAVALTSLVINGTNMPPGTYTYASFTPAQQSFIGNNGGTITVVNSAPALSPVADQEIIGGQTLTLTNAATDPNAPPQTLVFSLPKGPTNAVINSASGALTWRPTIAQAPSTNAFSVVVTDNGTPALSATQSFSVLVLSPAKPALTNMAGNGRQFSFTIGGSSGPDYTVLMSSNLFNWTPLLTNYSPVLPLLFTDQTATNASRRFYRVLLGP